MPSALRIAGTRRVPAPGRLQPLTAPHAAPAPCDPPPACDPSCDPPLPFFAPLPSNGAPAARGSPLKVDRVRGGQEEQGNLSKRRALDMEWISVFSGTIFSLQLQTFSASSVIAHPFRNVSLPSQVVDAGEGTAPRRPGATWGDAGAAVPVHCGAGARAGARRGVRFAAPTALPAGSSVHSCGGARTSSRAPPDSRVPAGGALLPGVRASGRVCVCARVVCPCVRVSVRACVRACVPDGGAGEAVRRGRAADGRRHGGGARGAPAALHGLGRARNRAASGERWAGRGWCGAVGARRSRAREPVRACVRACVR